MQFFILSESFKSCPQVSCSAKNNLENKHEGEVLLPLIPHWRQKFHWDCGLACCYMIFRYYGLQIGLRELYQTFWTRSVWTIDLVHLLHKYGLDFTYFTVTWGVRAEYSKQEFYRPHFQEDKVRVQHLFELAKSKQVKICKKSVPLDELKRRLARGYFARKYSNNIGYQNSVDVVLLLVDKRLVSCSLCQRKTFTGWLKKFCNAGFLGHYILLWGYSPEKDIFLYSDPASSQEYCTMTSEMLELCRKSRGTDEDLIVVHGLRQTS